MRVYEVEMRRTSYIIVTVEAEDADDAETKAWEEIEKGRSDIYDAQWEVENIDDITGEGTE